MSGLTKGQTQGGGHFANWVLEADSAGVAYQNIGAPDKTIHVFGDFGSGTLTFQGTNDPLKVDWAPLHDLAGAEIIVTTDTIAMIAENPRFVRPSLTGSTSPSLNINLLSRK